MKKTKAEVMPLGDKVLVTPFGKEEKSPAGIIIPDSVEKERSAEGKVVAVGAGKRNEQGDLIPLSVKKGDHVVFSKYGFDEITIEGKEYYIISEGSILAVIK